MTKRKEETIRIPISEYQKLTNKLEELAFNLVKKECIQRYSASTFNDTVFDAKSLIQEKLKGDQSYLDTFVKEVINNIRWEDVEVAISNHIKQYEKDKLELDEKYTK